MFTRTNDFFAKQVLVNSAEIEPQKLFDKTWKVISKEYYEPSLNHQDWARWRERYHNKIKTDDDARVAIDTMIASLNEPYTRFMPKKDYQELTTSITSKIYGIGVNIYSNSGKIEIFNKLEIRSILINLPSYEIMIARSSGPLVVASKRCSYSSTGTSIRTPISCI